MSASEHAISHGRGFGDTTYCQACVEYGAQQTLAKVRPAMEVATHLQMALDALASLRLSAPTQPSKGDDR